jgi:hypothetical protein
MWLMIPSRYPIAETWGVLAPDVVASLSSRTTGAPHPQERWYGTPYRLMCNGCRDSVVVERRVQPRTNAGPAVYEGFYWWPVPPRGGDVPGHACAGRCRQGKCCRTG